MEGEQDKARVVKIDSKESWDFHATQATTEGFPIVVHFTASWCMPSVAMNPFFEELALLHQDESLFLRVDMDDVKDVATKYGVKAMPTFLVMKEGVEIDKVVGANPEELNKRIEFLLSRPSSTPLVAVLP